MTPDKLKYRNEIKRSLGLNVASPPNRKRPNYIVIVIVILLTTFWLINVHI